MRFFLIYISLIFSFICIIFSAFSSNWNNYKSNKVFYLQVKENLPRINLKNEAPQNISHNSPKTKTVIAIGLGRSLNLASQNAATNALSQVVGTFINLEKQISKQQIIKKGIKSQTNLITKDIKTYSQGSIKYFELLDYENNNGVFEVSAKVEVRIDDFKAYINKLAYEKVTINRNVFTKLQNKKSQSKNQASLLLNDIILPITKGEVHTINIYDVLTLDELSELCKENYKKYFCKDYFRNNKFIFRYKNFLNDPNNVIIIPFTISLNDEFVENIINIFNNISDKKQIINGVENFVKYRQNSKNSYKIINEIFFIDNQKDNQNVLRINKFTIENYTNKINLLMKLDPKKSNAQSVLNCKIYNDLNIRINDIKDNTLFSKNFSSSACKSAYRDKEIIIYSNYTKDFDNSIFGFSSRNLFNPRLNSNSNTYATVFKKIRFLVFAYVNENVIEKANTVDIRFIKN